MIDDPYFSHEPTAKVSSDRWLLIVFLFIVLMLLCLWSQHFLETGSAIPFCYIERLNNPVAVTAVDDDALVLAAGRRIRLPFIKKLPKNDPAFTRDLRHGVELADEVKVIGLFDPRRECGNDLTVFRRLRIDLSELAGVLDPDGLDDASLSHEELQFFKEIYDTRSRDRDGMPSNARGQPYFP